jgi:hypothetical protein
MKSNMTGFRGVEKRNTVFRGVIYRAGKAVRSPYFTTPYAAAHAVNYMKGAPLNQLTFVQRVAADKEILPWIERLK